MSPTRTVASIYHIYDMLWHIPVKRENIRRKLKKGRLYADHGGLLRAVFLLRIISQSHQFHTIPSAIERINRQKTCTQ